MEHFDPIEVVVALTVEDCIRRGELRIAASLPAAIRRSQLVTVAVGAACAVVLLLLGGARGLPMAVLIAGLAVIAALISRPLLHSRVRRRLVQFYNASPDLRQATRYRFSRSGVDGWSEGRATHSDWAAYSRVEESDKDFVFFTEPPQLGTIPKHCFGTAADIDGFRELLRSAVPSRVTLRR